MAFRKKVLKSSRPSVIVRSGGALSSAVEHFLHTEGVAGSNPAARTIDEVAKRVKKANNAANPGQTTPGKG